MKGILLCLHKLYLIYSNTAIVFGFTQTKYSIMEGDKVSVFLSARQLAHLKVWVYTMDGSATSKFIIVHHAIENFTYILSFTVIDKS